MKKIISILNTFFITSMLLLTATAHAETLPVPPDSTTQSKAAKKPASPRKTAAKKKKIKKAASPVPKNSPVKELTKKKEDRILIKWDSNKDGPTKELTKDKIISIATSEAKELGYNPEKMDVFYDEGNKKVKRHSKLAGKNYQALYFSPKELMLGGDLWIFIDKNTGKVITHECGQ